LAHLNPVEGVRGTELSDLKRVRFDELTPWDFGTGLADRDFLVQRNAGRPS